MNALFRYTTGQQIKIRELLPLTPPSTQTWSSLPLRLPAIIPSSTVQTQTPEWALMMLERLANMFLNFQNELSLDLHTYRDIEAALNHARVLASQTSAMRPRLDLLAEMAREAKAHSDTHYRRRSRRTDFAKDWYIEKLLFVWECCGGATHTSGKVDGGQLVQFLRLASEPVFRHCGQKLLTPYAARGAVRKLRAERRN